MVRLHFKQGQYAVLLVQTPYCHGEYAVMPKKTAKLLKIKNYFGWNIRDVD